MTRIANAAEGLVYSSEADYPMEPFVWTDPSPFSPDALYKLTKLPQSTPVTQQELREFFAPMLYLPSEPTPEARARVKRFRSLMRVLRRNLSNLTVYKLGSVEMPTFIVGQLADGKFAGLRTTVVET